MFHTPLRHASLAGFAALALAACQPADSGASDAEEAAMTPDAGASQPGDMAMPAGPSTPFTEVERQMHEGMMEVSGGGIDEMWARKMIAHHQGAIDMSEIALEQSQDEQIRTMAQGMIDMQEREIEELRAWISANADGAGEGGAS